MVGGVIIWPKGDIIEAAAAAAAAWCWLCCSGVASAGMGGMPMLGIAGGIISGSTGSMLTPCTYRRHRGLAAAAAMSAATSPASSPAKHPHVAAEAGMLGLMWQCIFAHAQQTCCREDN